MQNHAEHDALPPKTCSIERLVTLPADVEKVLAGQKTATRRNGRYADVGEVMTLGGQDFVIEQVYSQALGDLTEEQAMQEGYVSLEEYKQSILSIHPGMRWVPTMRVWVHEFNPKQE
ncbi:ASCH domain-containing protein [Paenibacillus bouchesdurhonensis]|uniref:ASCH domain-containing protein n=1 Tax=Paenibacillus bouchesdurhonensis TaxID=1870990 RepID=UPI000DA5F3DA|nr:ASCH domain-containing protein [Paenibacillus bouchesdurhonensis]